MFRVVFSGETVNGFEPAAVVQAAAQRMRATPAQIDKVFSGRKIVLKKGLDERVGALYIAELFKIGMHVRLEREPQPAPLAAATPAAENKAEDALKASVLTATAIFGGRSPSDEDWAISTVHESARMEDMQSPEDTAVNHPYPNYRHYASGADPVIREPVPAQAAAVLAPLPQRSAHTEGNPVSTPAVCCPHCGKSFALAQAQTIPAANDASLPIRPSDSLQITAREDDQMTNGSLSRLAARITRMLPNGRAPA